MSTPVGIDLGTTNSVACVFRRGQIETIPVDGSPLLPSVLAVRADGTQLLGQRARSHATLAPSEVIASAKRFIGDGKTTWNLHGKDYTPVDVAAAVLARLKQATEAYLGETVHQAVITVPAYFNNNQRVATRQAGEQAGWEVLQLLPEPEAAAISYALDRGKNQTIVVYDLGGGTFDVSVLTVQGNQFVVQAVGGDAHLGGDDFDRLVGGYLVDALARESGADLSVLHTLVTQSRPPESGVPLAVRQGALRVLEAAEQAKRVLSVQTSAEVELMEVQGLSLDSVLHRETYESLISPLVEQTLTTLAETLASAGKSARDVARVVLVGGSTRNLLVRRRLKEAVKEPWAHERVDEAVAHGAAIVARHLVAAVTRTGTNGANVDGAQDQRPDKVVSVTPYSLGVCAYRANDRSRYINSILIPKNSPVPSRQTRPYRLRTRRSGNNEVHVFVLQGEGENPVDSVASEKYVFTEVTHVPARPAIVDIEYGYDHDGIITVAARERATGKSLPARRERVPEDMSWLSDVGSLLSDDIAFVDGAKAYTRYAGVQYIPEALSDQFGNAKGSEYDLAADGTFEGYTIAVLHLYTGEGFDFKPPQGALEEKGFHVLRWTTPPSLADFQAGLDTACQLWVISAASEVLSAAHIDEITRFYDSGRGLYIWGDNEPYFADANRLTQRLFTTSLSGNTPGDKSLSLQRKTGDPGFSRHLITTGIQSLYEGITVSSLVTSSTLSPLVYGSDRQTLVAVHDSGGTRAIIDGGFTRLYIKWDTAGTARYVKNAAAWLFNYERFGL